MQPSSLYGHVIEVFSEFRDNPVISADSVIRRFFLTRKYLGSKDRRFIADTYFGAIKNWMRLEAVALDAFGDKDNTLEQIIAAYAIVCSRETPESAFEAFARWKLPIDALERCFDRERERSRLAKLSPHERFAVFYSFPEWCVERIAEEYGEDQVESILLSCNGEAPTGLRANTLLTTREELKEELAKEECETTISSLAADALLLTKRQNIFGFNSFREGKFEVQDEASQLVAPFANIRKTAIKVLDACAGAGGKTLHLSALMKNRGEIYATDAEGYKLEELAKRSRRAGAQNIRIVYPDDYETRLGSKIGWFDIVLLDVPCTGTGTLRRNPGIKWLLTEQMLSELVEKQRIILEANCTFVKPGGTLLYSTCSLLKEEGEYQMDRFVQNHPEFSIEETLRTTTMPGVDCDGFFIARLRKSIPV